MLAPGFTGPLALLVLGGYRLVEVAKLFKNNDYDFSDSNWIKKENGRKVFQRQNLMALAGNFLPNIGALISMALAFKFAAMS